MPSALPWIIGTALPWVVRTGIPAVATAATAYNAGRDAGLWGPQPPASPPPPPTLDLAQARDLAAQVLDPLYQDVLENRLREVQRRQIASGFFGQAPAAEQMMRAAADVERARIGQIGNLAVQLQGQTEEQAARNAALQMQAYQMALQRDPLGRLAQGAEAIGRIGQVFPGVLDTMNRWLSGGAGPTQPVNLDTVSRAMDFWSPSTASVAPVLSTYPYGNILRPGTATQMSWVDPYRR